MAVHKNDGIKYSCTKAGSARQYIRDGWVKKKPTSSLTLS